MQVNETRAHEKQDQEKLDVETIDGGQRPVQVASWGWLTGFLVIGVGVMAMGMLAQGAPTPSGAAAGQFASHNQAIRIYLSLILMDWALLYYCWAGVHRYGGNLWTLAGGRWTSWKSVAVDVGIALPFWGVLEGAALGVHKLLDTGALGSGAGKTVESLLPHSLLEVVVWIATCITAGICEEMAFRGFVQRQLHVLTGNIWLAVLGQGLIFGFFHSYQGWTNVAAITVIGILFGALAAWRKNLRANMVAHAWTDFFEGWLKFVVWR
jgi:membrane protease YdiL (CAAX protease family)